jgi:hypothetical protein
MQALQIGHQFRMTLPDLDPAKSGVVGERAIVVKIGSVARSVGKSDLLGGPVRPFLRFESGWCLARAVVEEANSARTTRLPQ